MSNSMVGWFGWLGAIGMVAASLSCATGSSAADEEASENDAKSVSGSGESPSDGRSGETADRNSSRLPNPSRDGRGDSGGEEPREADRSCRIERKDWEQLDFHDASALHRQLNRRHDRFAGCLEALPTGTRYFVVFQVESGEMTGAEPADLSKLETRRLETSEREEIVACLENRIEEGNFTAEAAESSYEVTHPFCAP